jgi:hypothetical protein
MRLIFATIVAAATLTATATPALADGERGRGHHNGDDYNRDGERGHDGERGNYDNNRNNGYHNRDRYRRDYGHDRRGSHYWGPSARQWSHWDRSWGDPHRYARQWGFDRYDHNRGWQRGNTWYSSPSQWGDWGGWSWSFQANNGGHNGYNGYNQYGHNGYNQYSNNRCNIYRTEDWINGRRAVVTYTGCADRYGRVYEQPNTRRIESWVW